MCSIDVAHVCGFQTRLECASVLVGTRMCTRAGSSYMTDRSGVFHRTLISFFGSFDRLVLPALALVFPSRMHVLGVLAGLSCSDDFPRWHRKIRMK